MTVNRTWTEKETISSRQTDKQKKRNHEAHSKAQLAAKELVDSTFASGKYDLLAFLESYKQLSSFKHHTTNRVLTSKKYSWTHENYALDGWPEGSSSGVSTESAVKTTVKKRHSKAIPLSNYFRAHDLVIEMGRKISEHQKLESLMPKYNQLKSKASVDDMKATKAFIKFIDESGFEQESFEDFSPTTQMTIIVDALREAKAEIEIDTPKGFQRLNDIRALAATLHVPAEIAKEFIPTSSERRKLLKAFEIEGSELLTGIRSKIKKLPDTPLMKAFSHAGGDNIKESFASLREEFATTIDAAVNLSNARKGLSGIKSGVRKDTIPEINLDEAQRSVIARMVTTARQAIQLAA